MSSSSSFRLERMSAEEEEEEAWDDIGRCKLGGEDEADEIGEDDDDGDDVSLE